MLTIDPNLRTYPELEGKTFLVCVGAMRCATSWIYHYLASLPDVGVSPLKELHFFNTKFPQHALYDMDHFAVRRLQSHIAREGTPAETLRQSPTFQASVDRAQMIFDDNAYFGHFARLCTAKTRLLCDITPAYAVIGLGGFAYLKNFLSTQGVSLKLVFIMRDPVERLWSQLVHMQDMEPSAGYASKWAEAVQSPRIAARADYAGTVSGLDATFPADDLLFLFYENLFAEESLRRLCGFAKIGYRPGKIAEVRNGARLKMDLPDDARNTFLRCLAPQYDFCRDRFEGMIPSRWAR